MMDLTQAKNQGEGDSVQAQVHASTVEMSELNGVTLPGMMVIEEELGRGAYGKVHKARYQEKDQTDKFYAVKEIHPFLIEGVDDGDKETIKRNFVKECLCCSANRHPNIVEFVGVFYSNQSNIPIMAMEIMEHSLTSFVQKNKSNITIETKISILFDVSCGLAFLHARSPPIIHRDLSSNNVMLTSNLVAKIGDLGVARVIRAERTQTKSRLTKVPGTKDFMPPEALLADPVYGLPVDVFSFAAVALHLVSEEWPSPAAPKMTDPQTLVALSEVGRRQQYLDKMIGENAVTVLRQLVEGCLNDNPIERPTIQNVKDVIERLKVCKLNCIPSYAFCIQQYVPLDAQHNS